VAKERHLLDSGFGNVFSIAPDGTVVDVVKNGYVKLPKTFIEVMKDLRQKAPTDARAREALGMVEFRSSMFNSNTDIAAWLPPETSEKEKSLFREQYNKLSY